LGTGIAGVAGAARRRRKAQAKMRGESESSDI